METNQTDQGLKLKVKDTGMGIPADQLPFIFDRFYQVDDTHTRKAEGTGIGLALTKELVKLLGGSIEAKSKEGEGSTFQVLLPISRKAQIVEELTIKDTQPSREESIMEPLVLPKGIGEQNLPFALIVEDNQDVVQYIMACLEGKYQLEVAYNGQEGINTALEIVPDIIISDVMMPEKDGF